MAARGPGRARHVCRAGRPAAAAAAAPPHRAVLPDQERRAAQEARRESVKADALSHRPRTRRRTTRRCGRWRRRSHEALDRARVRHQRRARARAAAAAADRRVQVRDAARGTRAARFCRHARTSRCDLLSQQEEFARSRLKLQARYHHVLVDEFQDTSRLQWRLIELLIDAWGEGEGVVGHADVDLRRRRSQAVDLSLPPRGGHAARRGRPEDRRAAAGPAGPAGRSRTSFRAVPGAAHVRQRAVDSRSRATLHDSGAVHVHRARSVSGAGRVRRRLARWRARARPDRRVVHGALRVGRGGRSRAADWHARWSGRATGRRGRPGRTTSRFCSARGRASVLRGRARGARHPHVRLQGTRVSSTRRKCRTCRR